LKSGIVEFSLPKAISSDATTILNSKLLWIRAVAHEDQLVTSDSDAMLSFQRIAALPDLVAIIAQAGIAEFENHNIHYHILQRHCPQNNCKIYRQPCSNKKIGATF